MSSDARMARYGYQPHDSDPLTRRCRLLQSWYRVEVAKQAECGPWRKGAQCVGSSLVDGRGTGANFISLAALAYARLKVAEKKMNRDLTIDEHRLYNNMLSSQPMCFNLFADLKLGVDACWRNSSEVLAAMFADSGIAQVGSVEVEMIPCPTSAYIDDKTAFDALIHFQGKNGKPGIAAIETKYSDKLGGNVATKQERKYQVADDLGLLTSEGRIWYQQHGFDQVARNLLLTLAYAREKEIPEAINYVLGPECDAQTPEIIASLQRRLTPKYQDRIIWLPLETAVERGLAMASAYHIDHLKRFRERYLDFGQIEHLLPFPPSTMMG